MYYSCCLIGRGINYFAAGPPPLVGVQNIEPLRHFYKSFFTAEDIISENPEITPDSGQTKKDEI
jgi:hypothetical protein